jgi:hypothetical protein
MFARNIILELILNAHEPESLIRQVRRRSRSSGKGMEGEEKLLSRCVSNAQNIDAFCAHTQILCFKAETTKYRTSRK